MKKKVLDLIKHPVSGYIILMYTSAIGYIGLVSPDPFSDIARMFCIGAMGWGIGGMLGHVLYAPPANTPPKKGSNRHAKQEKQDSGSISGTINYGEDYGEGYGNTRRRDCKSCSGCKGAVNAGCKVD